MASAAASTSTDSLPPSRARCWRFASAVFDERTLELRVAGELVDIDRKPSEVLLYLLLHAGEVVTKDELLEAVWPRRILTETALTKCIARLREALRDDDQTIIRTLYGLGYRLMAAVHVEASVSPPTPHFDFRPGDSPPLRPHWKLLVRLGGGSHGEAWLAEHEKTAEKRVFKFALDAPALGSLKREITLFRLLNDTLDERARIVRLLDWNLEQPPCFIEAEYVSGGSLTDWITQQGGFVHIAASQRIDFAAQIAEALAATHSVGVLHKDLKPSNVLVDIDDTAEPAIKLGDFGSGGMLDPDRLDALHITRLGFTGTVAPSEASGTLTYLAPEVLAGQPSTVQTDIYALGVILYQLAVGDLHRPLAPGWERDVEDELLREDIAAAADIDPARRLGDAGELARRLRALDARRQQRAAERAAAAAAELAQRDAQRARQEAERLRARRTGMRIALAVLIAALVAGSFLFVDAQRARHRAEAESARAKAVSDFLNDDVLTVVNSGDQPVKDLTVKQLLDSASQQVDKRFAEQPAVAAEIDLSLGKSYNQLESEREAAGRFERGLARIEKSGVSDEPIALELISNLIGAKTDMGELPQFIGQAEAAYVAGRASLGPLHPAVIKLRSGLAAAHWSLGQWQTTLTEYRQILADRQRTDAKDLKGIGRAHFGIGWLLGELADYAAAENELRTAIAMLVPVLGEDSIEVADAHFDIGKLYVDLGRYADAETEFLTAMHTFSKWEADDRGEIQGVQTERARSELYQGHLDEAAKRFQTVIDTLNSWQTGERDQTSTMREGLALTYQQQGRLNDAIDTMRGALESSRRWFGESHPQTRRMRLELADMLRQAGQVSLARQSLADDPVVAFDDLPQDHPLHADLLRVQGLLARDEGNIDAARSDLGEATRIYASRFGEGHWLTKRARADFSTLSN